mgnify:CR=1 FL=1
MRWFLSLAALAMAAVAVPGMARADAIISTQPGNDCAGVLGRPFENCAYNGSPIIAKFDRQNDGTFVASLNNGPTFFPSIDGSEFSITYTGGNSGSWTYTPGAGDPLITVFVVKWGNSFTIYANDGDPNSGTFVIPGQQGLSHISFYDTKQPTIVPEPMSLALLGMGLVGLGVVARRRPRG